MTEGINRVGGQRDVYQKSLQLMMREIEKSIQQTNEFLSAGDMNHFRTEVHGIKGALANIGATALSEKAFELETASAEKDTGFCEKSLPSFLEGLEALLEGLKEAFLLIKQEEEKVEIPPELSLILERMKEAIHETDLVIIDKEMQKLSEIALSGALKEAIERIKDRVMVMDYAGATAEIKKMSP